MNNNAKKETKQTPSKGSNKFFLLFLGCLQNCLGSGLLYGWAGIAGSSLIAPTNAGGAGLTLQETTTIFSTASCIFSAGSFFLGLLLDKFGPRICSTISNALVCLGCGIIALSRNQFFYVLGFSILSFGGPGIQVATVHLGNLFPKNKNAIITFITSTLTLSFSMFPIFDQIWNTFGFSISFIFGVYTMVLAYMTLLSVLVWPDAPFPLLDEDKDGKSNERFIPQTYIESTSKYSQVIDDENKIIGDELIVHEEGIFGDELIYQEKTHVVFKIIEKEGRIAGDEMIESEGDISWEEMINDNEEFIIESYNRSGVNIHEVQSIKEASFLTQVSSGVYLRIFSFFFVTSYWANFYIATITLELIDENKFSTSTQKELLASFTYINSLGILFAPMIGYTLDNCGSVFTAFFTIFLGMLQIILIIIFENEETILILSFWIYCIFRSSFYSYLFACIPNKLGFSHYGKLSGIGTFLAGLSQLSYLKLSEWGHVSLCNADGCSEGQWTRLHLIQLSSMFLLLLVPFIDLSEDRIDKVEKRSCDLPTNENENLLKENMKSYSSVSTEGRT